MFINASSRSVDSYAKAEPTVDILNSSAFKRGNKVLMKAPRLDSQR